MAGRKLFYFLVRVCCEEGVVFWQLVGDSFCWESGETTLFGPPLLGWFLEREVVLGGGILIFWVFVRAGGVRKD